MSIIEKSFKPLYGNPCWGITYDRRTNLAMNFGTPRLKVIREPHATKSKLERVKQRAAQRMVAVRGQWKLWIFCGYWRIYRNGRLLGGYSSTFRTGTRAADSLEGEKLLRVDVDPKTGATRFEFDLGSVLEVRRLRNYESDEDIWILYKPNGYALSVHGDGTYDHVPGSGIDKRKLVASRPLD